MSNDIRFGIKLSYDGKEVSGGVTANRDQLRQFTEEAKKAGASASASFDAVGNAAARAAQQVKQTSAQTAFALRQLPMQMTDITVGLASGQSPFMVLMQQGGQLKDSFGGIAPAARAVVGYVAQMVNPMTVAAAAVGSLAVAYYQGSREADAMAKAVVMSGNVAGTTVGRLQELAGSVSAATGATKGAAADVMADLVGTGKMSADVLELAASAALRLQRAGVQAIDDTVKHFEALGKSPVEASAKLNEQYGYLTAAVYRQIKALEDQGRADEAAALAQRTYAEAMVERSGKVEERLGALEKLWKGVKGAATGAWDAMLGVGRTDTPDEKLAALGRRIQELRDSPAAKLDSVYGRLLRQQLSQAEQEYQRTLDGKAADEQAARAAGERQKQERAAIDLAKEAEKYLDKQAQKKREIARVEQLYAASLKDSAAAEARRVALAGIEDKYKPAKRAKTDLERILERGQQNELEAYYATAGEETMREVAEKRALSSAAEDMRRKAAQERAGAAMQESTAGLQSAFAHDNARAAERNMPTVQRELAESLRQVEERASAARREISHKAAALKGDEVAQAAMREELEKVTAAEDAQKSAVRGLWEEQQALNASWQYGARQALREYGDEAENVAARTRRSFTDGMRRAEDAVVQFGMTGKVSLRDFANYAISEFYRIKVAQPFVGALASWGGSLFDGWFNGGNVGAGQVVANTPSTYSVPVDLSMPVAVNHSGALVGAEAGAVRNVPLAIFANAPRYHSGGAIGPGERAIIAKDGEGVFTEGQMRKLAPASSLSSPVQFNVTLNAPGADAGAVASMQQQLGALQSWVVKTVPGLVSRQQLRNRITPMVA